MKRASSAYKVNKSVNKVEEEQKYLYIKKMIKERYDLKKEPVEWSMAHDLKN